MTTNSEILTTGLGSYPELALKQNEGESRAGGHYEQEARERTREKEKERAAHNRIGYAKKGGPSFFYCFPASERDYFASRIGGRRER